MTRVICMDDYATFRAADGRYWWQHRYRRNYYGCLVGPFDDLNDAMEHARKCVADMRPTHTQPRGDDNAQY
jgi:hypothetical protein